VAAKVFMVFPFLVAGLATYAFARALGMNFLGALTAAVAFEFSPYYYGVSPCCPTFYQGACWLPVMLLGLELAFRSRSR
jgi:hypothetical protein